MLCCGNKLTLGSAWILGWRKGKSIGITILGSESYCSFDANEIGALAKPSVECVSVWSNWPSNVGWFGLALVEKALSAAESMLVKGLGVFCLFGLAYVGKAISWAESMTVIGWFGLAAIGVESTLFIAGAAFFTDCSEFLIPKDTWLKYERLLEFSQTDFISIYYHRNYNVSKYNEIKNLANFLSEGLTI